MPKRFFQDIVPNNSPRRTIRQIPIPSDRRKEPEHRPVLESLERKESRETDEESNLPSGNHEPLRYYPDKGGLPYEPTTRGVPRSILWIIVGACAVAAFVALYSFFSKAVITVTPKSQQVTLEVNLKGSPDGTNADLAYSTLPLTKDAGQGAPATGEKQVETKAGGTIIVYNDLGPASQRLIKNTRFQTASGLVFRIPASIVVPGRKAISGKTYPGSVETPVTADGAGPQYNISLSDFTIPGLKGDAARYTHIYARSKTPMAGGFVGAIKIVSDEVLAQTRARLDASLKKDVLTEAATETPDGFILYPGATKIDFESLPNTDLGNGTVSINERIHFTGYLLNTSALAKVLATQNLGREYDGSPIQIIDPPSLSFTLLNKDLFPNAQNQMLSFNLKGTVRFVWQFDMDKLKMDLAGKKKEEVPGILSQYPSIAKSSIVLRPFWRNGFPSKKEDIHVDIVIPKE